MSYYKQFSSVLDFSNEKEVEISLLKKFFQNKKYSTLLDIGAGTGIIPLSIAEHFEHIDIVEKNEVFYPFYNGSFRNIYKSDITQLSITNQYDVILMSHVLPYINQDVLLVTIERLLSVLKDNGYLIIFEMTADGVLGKIKKHMLKRHFYSTYELVVKTLEQRKIQYHENEFEVRISTQTKKGIIDTIHFFCEKYENEFKNNINFVETILDNECYDHKLSQYSFNYSNKAIFIQKI